MDRMRKLNRGPGKRIENCCGQLPLGFTSSAKERDTHLGEDGSKMAKWAYTFSHHRILASLIPLIYLNVCK